MLRLDVLTQEYLTIFPTGVQWGRPVGASNGRAGGFPKTLGMQQTQYVSPVALEPHTGFRPHAVRYRMSRGCKAGSQVENEVVCDQGDWLSGV